MIFKLAVYSSFANLNKTNLIITLGSHNDHNKHNILYSQKSFVNPFFGSSGDLNTDIAGDHSTMICFTFSNILLLYGIECTVIIQNIDLEFSVEISVLGYPNSNKWFIRDVCPSIKATHISH